MDGLQIKKIFLIWLIYVQVQTVSFTELSKVFANESLGVNVTTQLVTGFKHTSSKQEEQEVYTALPETNIAPGNRPSQKATSIPTIHFQVQTGSFRGGGTYTRDPG